VPSSDNMPRHCRRLRFRHTARQCPAGCRCPRSSPPRACDSRRPAVSKVGIAYQHFETGCCTRLVDPARGQTRLDHDEIGLGGPSASAILWCRIC
jgi:hypothetical protein